MSATPSKYPEEIAFGVPVDSVEGALIMATMNQQEASKPKPRPGFEHLIDTPMLAISDPFFEIQPFCAELYLKDPHKWGGLMPADIGGDLNREDEEEFLLKHFTPEQIHLYGGAEGTGHGFRFVKQCFNTMCLWNGRERLQAFVAWWVKENMETVQDVNMVKWMLNPDTKVSTFFMSAEVKVYGPKFLEAAMGLLRESVREFHEKRGTLPAALMNKESAELVVTAPMVVESAKAAPIGETKRSESTAEGVDVEKATESAHGKEKEKVEEQAPKAIVTNAPEGKSTRIIRIRRPKLTDTVSPFPSYAELDTPAAAVGSQSAKLEPAHLAQPAEKQPRRFSSNGQRRGGYGSSRFPKSGPFNQRFDDGGLSGPQTGFPSSFQGQMSSYTGPPPNMFQSGVPSRGPSGDFPMTVPMVVPMPQPGTTNDLGDRVPSGSVPIPMFMDPRQYQQMQLQMAQQMNTPPGFGLILQDPRSIGKYNERSFDRYRSDEAVYYNGNGDGSQRGRGRGHKQSSSHSSNAYRVDHGGRGTKPRRGSRGRGDSSNGQHNPPVTDPAFYNRPGSSEFGNERGGQRCKRNSVSHGLPVLQCHPYQPDGGQWQGPPMIGGMQNISHSGFIVPADGPPQHMHPGAQRFREAFPQTSGQHGIPSPMLPPPMAMAVSTPLQTSDSTPARFSNDQYQQPTPNPMPVHQHPETVDLKEWGCDKDFIGSKRLDIIRVAVLGLSVSVSEEEVRDFLEQRCGPIVKCIQPPSTYTNLRMFIIEFATVDAVRKALAMKPEQLYLCDHQMRIETTHEFWQPSHRGYRTPEQVRNTNGMPMTRPERNREDLVQTGMMRRPSVGSPPVPRPEVLQRQKPMPVSTTEAAFPPTHTKGPNKKTKQKHAAALKSDIEAAVPPAQAAVADKKSKQKAAAAPTDEDSAASNQSRTPSRKGKGKQKQQPLTTTETLSRAPTPAPVTSSVPGRKEGEQGGNSVPGSNTTTPREQKQDPITTAETVSRGPTPAPGTSSIRGRKEGEQDRVSVPGSGTATLKRNNKKKPKEQQHAHIEDKNAKPVAETKPIGLSTATNQKKISDKHAEAVKSGSMAESTENLSIGKERASQDIPFVTSDPKPSAADADVIRTAITAADIPRPLHIDIAHALSRENTKPPPFQRSASVEKTPQRSRAGSFMREQLEKGVEKRERRLSLMNPNSAVASPTGGRTPSETISEVPPELSLEEKKDPVSAPAEHKTAAAEAPVDTPIEAGNDKPEEHASSHSADVKGSETGDVTVFKSESELANERPVPSPLRPAKEKVSEGQTSEDQDDSFHTAAGTPESNKTAMPASSTTSPSAVSSRQASQVHKRAGSGALRPVVPMVPKSQSARSFSQSPPNRELSVTIKEPEKASKEGERPDADESAKRDGAISEQSIPPTPTFKTAPTTPAILEDATTPRTGQAAQPNPKEGSASPALAASEISPAVVSAIAPETVVPAPAKKQPAAKGPSKVESLSPFARQASKTKSKKPKPIKGEKKKKQEDTASEPGSASVSRVASGAVTPADPNAAAPFLLTPDAAPFFTPGIESSSADIQQPASGPDQASGRDAVGLGINAPAPIIQNEPATPKQPPGVMSWIFGGTTQSFTPGDERTKAKLTELKGKEKVDKGVARLVADRTQLPDVGHATLKAVHVATPNAPPDVLGGSIMKSSKQAQNTNNNQTASVPTSGGEHILIANAVLDETASQSKSVASSETTDLTHVKDNMKKMKLQLRIPSEDRIDASEISTPVMTARDDDDLESNVDLCSDSSHTLGHPTPPSATSVASPASVEKMSLVPSTSSSPGLMTGGPARKVGNQRKTSGKHKARPKSKAETMTTFMPSDKVESNSDAETSSGTIRKLIRISGAQYIVVNSVQSEPKQEQKPEQKKEEQTEDMNITTQEAMPIQNEAEVNKARDRMKQLQLEEQEHKTRGGGGRWSVPGFAQKAGKGELRQDENALADEPVHRVEKVKKLEMEAPFTFKSAPDVSSPTQSEGGMSRKLSAAGTVKTERLEEGFAAKMGGVVVKLDGDVIDEGGTESKEIREELGMHL